MGRLIFLILAAALFAGCTDSDTCAPPVGTSSVEITTILNAFCNEEAARWDLIELTNLKPYSGVWCFKQTYVINNTIATEEILIGTVRTYHGRLRYTYYAVELDGPYKTCEGR